MSWVYLPKDLESCRFFQEREAGCLEQSSWDGGQSVMSRITNTASKSSRRESATATLTMPLSGTTLEHSTETPGVDRWKLSRQDSPASYRSCRLLRIGHLKEALGL